MATDHEHQHHHSSHGDDGVGPLNHETTDISVDGIGKLTIAFAVIMAIITAALYGSYRLLDRRANAQDLPISKISERPRGMDGITPDLMDRPNGIAEMGRAPAGPRLLTNEPLWLADYRDTQRQALTSYGWVDRGAGTVRIPIARAKQLIVERGLPQRPATDATAPADGTAPPAGDPGTPGEQGTPLPTTTPQSTTAGSGPRPGSE